MKDFFIEAKKIEAAKEQLEDVLDIAGKIRNAIVGLIGVGFLGYFQYQTNMIQLLIESDEKAVLKLAVFAFFAIFIIMALYPLVELIVIGVAKKNPSGPLLFKWILFRTMCEGIPYILTGMIFMGAGIYVMISGHGLQFFAGGLTVFLMGFMAFTSGGFHLYKNVTQYRAYLEGRNPFDNPTKMDQIINYYSENHMPLIGGLIFIGGSFMTLSAAYSIPEIETIGVVIMTFFALLMMAIGGALIYYAVKQYDKFVD